MPTRWIYDTAGKPAYYQEGKNIYAPQTGTCEFYENGGWWYRMQGCGAGNLQIGGSTAELRGLLALGMTFTSSRQRAT